MGYVNDVFDSDDAGRTHRAPWPSGTCATPRPARAGWPTRSRSSIDSAHGQLALGHNGNLINAGELRDALVREGAIFQTSTDSEVVVHLFARSRRDSVEAAIVEAIWRRCAAPFRSC